MLYDTMPSVGESRDVGGVDAAGDIGAAFHLLRRGLADVSTDLAARQLIVSQNTQDVPLRRMMASAA